MQTLAFHVLASHTNQLQGELLEHMEYMKLEPLVEVGLQSALPLLSQLDSLPSWPILKSSHYHCHLSDGVKHPTHILTRLSLLIDDSPLLLAYGLLHFIYSLLLLSRQSNELSLSIHNSLSWR